MAVAQDPSPALTRLRTAIEGALEGKPEVVELALITLLARGHVLIEDVPGVGKTTLAQALAQAIGCEMRRVQFTSDLLPSDILGVSIYDQRKGDFYLRKGPIFSHVLVADEINRASPRTQSALLEAMNEGQVSLDGQTLMLPDPFFVIATQNPDDFAGTFPLPEVQLDRFMMRLRIGYPPPHVELRLIQENDRDRGRTVPAILDPVAPVRAPAAGAADHPGSRPRRVPPGRRGGHPQLLRPVRGRLPPRRHQPGPRRPRPGPAAEPALLHRGRHPPADAPRAGAPGPPRGPGPRGTCPPARRPRTPSARSSPGSPFPSDPMPDSPVVPSAEPSGALLEPGPPGGPGPRVALPRGRLPSPAALIPAVTHRNHLRVTREGKWYIGITVGVGLAAMNTGNNLLYLLLGVLLSLIVISGILSEVSLWGLSVVRRLPARAQVGRFHQVEIEVYNSKKKVPSYAIEVEDLRAGQPADKRCFFLKISPASAQVAAYRRTPQRRGQDRHVGFRIATRFPFGFFEKSREIEANGELLIYPAVDPVRLGRDDQGRDRGGAGAPGPRQRRRHRRRSPGARGGRPPRYLLAQEHRPGAPGAAGALPGDQPRDPLAPGPGPARQR
jgi:hypothetical protein